MLLLRRLVKRYLLFAIFVPLVGRALIWVSRRIEERQGPQGLSRRLRQGGTLLARPDRPRSG